MAITFLQLAIALCALSSSASAQRNCYYPGGKVVARDSPCNPTAAHSNCCGPDDVCLSNGLCFVTALNILTRGSCTDSSWAPGSCTDICTGSDSQGNQDAPNGWANVWPCWNNSVTQLFYCEGSNDAQCGGPKVFNILRGDIADHRHDPSPSLNSSQSNSTTTCSSSSLNTTTTNSSNTSSTCPSAAGKEAAIGAGVGIPLGLGLGAALFLFLRERRLRQRLTTSSHRAAWPSQQNIFAQSPTDDRSALIQQQQLYELQPAAAAVLGQKGFEGGGVGVHEVDAGVGNKRNVYEVADNNR